MDTAAAQADQEDKGRESWWELLISGWQGRGRAGTRFPGAVLRPNRADDLAKNCCSLQLDKPSLLIRRSEAGVVGRSKQTHAPPAAGSS